MLFLQVLGGLALRVDVGELPVSATQRRRLVFLALLAAAGERGLSRERLCSLLWPESSAERARHALDQLLYASRRDLGKNVVDDAGGMLRLNPEVIRTDLAAFRALLDAGDDERAVARYTGPFLEGVYPDGELERWAETERSQLAREYAAGLEKLARARTATDDLAGVVDVWHRRAAQDPHSGRIALQLMSALEAVGDRAAAIRHASVYSALLREELDAEPDPEVMALAERLRRTPTDRTPPPGAATTPRPAAPGEAPVPISEPTSRSTAAVPSAPLRLQPVWAIAAGCLLILGVAGWLLSQRARQPAFATSPTTSAAASVVVLPFTDRSDGGTDEYFSDGLTDELTHALNQVEGLRVVARTSAFSFKGKGADAREIGDALDVAYIVEGSVRREAGRIRITVQLIDSRTGYSLWSEMYDREMRDIFAVQEEIAHAVAERLRPGAPRSRLAAAGARPANLEAYNLVLLGRYLWNRATADATWESIRLFEAALREDSLYAPAYMGLSEGYNTLVDNDWDRHNEEELLRRAESAARAAIRLDPGLADAYVALGHLHIHRWDRQGAEREFRRALELDPDNPLAHQYLGVLLALQGRMDPAVEALRKAQELDPLSLRTQGSLGYVLYLARRHGEAERHLRNLISMDSARGGPHLRLGLVYIEQGRYDQAIEQIRTAVRLPGGGPARGIPALGYAYARAGRRAEAERIAAAVQRGLPDNEFSAYYAVALLGALGENDRAFALLLPMAAEPNSSLVDVAVDPMMDQLRSDPRFALLLERLGFDSPPPAHPS